MAMLFILTCLSGCKEENSGKITAITVLEAEYISSGTFMRISLKDNETLQLTPFIMPRDADNKTVRYANKYPNLMSVSENGLITAKMPGTDTLKVSSIDGSGITVDYTVLITDHMVKATAINVTAAGSNIMLKIGGVPFDLAACVSLSPADTYDKTVTYKSNDMTVATVTADGMVSPVNEGFTTITITTADGSNISRDCNVTVQAAVEKWDDLSRAGWTVTSEQGNGFTHVTDGAIDGSAANILVECTGTASSENKCLALAKPGRAIAAGQSAEIPLDFRPYFIVDMKASQTFNYFRWRHRTDNNYNRLKLFAVNVYTSNDGVTFTQVTPDEPEAPAYPTWYWIPVNGGYVGDVALSDAANYYIIDLQKTLSSRYVKIEMAMWAQDYDSHHPDWPGLGATAYGNAVQISEFGLGYNYWE